jgi:hypothetical protein
MLRKRFKIYVLILKRNEMEDKRTYSTNLVIQIEVKLWVMHIY